MVYSLSRGAIRPSAGGSEKSVSRSLLALETARERAYVGLLETLGLGLAIASNVGTKQFLRDHIGSERLALRLPGSTAWLEIGPSLDAVVSRDQPIGMPVLHVTDAVKEMPEVRRVLLAALRKEGIQVSTKALLDPIVSPIRNPTRGEVESLAQWTPLLEQGLYSMATQLSMVLDTIRRLVLAGTDLPRAEVKQWRRLYWAHASLMGRLYLLACSTGGRPWLTEMSRSFVWTKWTPSIALVRERSVWLCAIAARVAAAFGADAIKAYRTRLEGTAIPMEAFDALFALTAIAQSDAGVRAEVVAQLRSSRIDSPLAESETMRMTVAAALRILDDPGAAAERGAFALGWNDSPVRGFATPAALAGDGASFLPNGDILALLAVPMSLTAQPGEFFAAVASRRPDVHLGLRDVEIAELISRGWNAGTFEDGRGLPH